jgi:hypothetical protein
VRCSDLTGWGDTLGDEEMLELLKRYNATGQALRRL